MSHSYRPLLVSLIILLMLGAPVLGGAVSAAMAKTGDGDGSRSGFFFGTAYTTYNEMKNQFATWEKDYPGLIKSYSIGTTVEGRTVYAVKVSDDVETEDPNEPEALIIGNHHAREIITVEIPMLLIKDLLKGYGKNDTLTRMVNTQQMWFIPMLNPDGHVMVEADQDWRKNKAGSDGTDLNRNYEDGHWGLAGGASTNPFAEDYKGPAPFSENETRAVRDLGEAHNFTTSVSYHAFSELVLYPYGWTTATVPSADLTIFQTLANAYAAYNGYTAIQSRSLYMTTGDSDDWLYSNESIYAISIEVGTDFYPADSEIPGLYDENKEATLDNMRRGRKIAGDPAIVDAGIYAISVAPQTVPGEVSANTTADVNVRVMNFGTAEAVVPVTVHVTCVNNTSYDFSAQNNINVQTGFVGDIHIPWPVPFAGDMEYCITATTGLAGDNYAWNDAKTVTMKSGKFYNISFALAPEDVGPALLYPSQTRFFNITLTNTGNAKDSYILSNTGDRPTWASFTRMMELDALSSAIIPVNVTVPRTATKDIGGHFKFNIKAQSLNDSVRTSTVSYYVDVGDAMPVAAAGPDVTAGIFEEVTFDGSGSTVPIGFIANYTWISSDGWVGYGPVAAHAFKLAGVYDVKLDVTSDLGMKDEDVLYASVPLVRNIQLDVTPLEGEQVPGIEVAIPVNVTNIGSAVEDIDVRITADELNFDETRTVFNLVPLGRDKVEFTLPVPLMSEAGTEYMVIVNASSREDTEAFNVTTLVIKVATIRGLSHMVPKETEEVDPGQDVSFDIRFDNAGNIAETVTFDYPDDVEGILMVGPANITVEPHGNMLATVDGLVPDDIVAGDYKVPVTISYIDPESGKRKDNLVEFVIKVLPLHDALFVISPVNVTIKDGEVADLSVELVNNGNVEETIGLVVTTDLGYEWQAANFTLAPFSNRTVVLRIITQGKDLAYGLTEHPVILKYNTMSKQATVTVDKPEPVKSTGTIEAGSSMYLLIALLMLALLVSAAIVFLVVRRKGRGPQGMDMRVAQVPPPQQQGPEPPSSQPEQAQGPMPGMPPEPDLVPGPEQVGDGKTP